MNTEATFEQPKVGVVLMKEGSCQGWLKPTVDGIRAMLYEISAEVGVPIVIRDLTAQEAINGAMPPQVVAEGWQYYYRMNSAMVPLIIINGKIVSVGPQPDRNALKNILLNASPIKS